MTQAHANQNRPRNELPADTHTAIQPISNRHTPELEIELSYRKQRTGPRSNRHKFVFCNFLAESLLQGHEISNRKRKLLDFCLTCRKLSTSHFLIDNFRASVPLAAPKQFIAKAVRSRLVTVDSRLPSNRQYPELESFVRYRKQTTENFLIAKFRHILRQLRGSPVNPVCSRLSTANSKLPPLIANETHSREESNTCKQDTYQILIANEFHCDDPRQKAASFASFASLLLVLLFSPVSLAQRPDPQLLSQIRAIKAIDNHSHPPKVVAPGEKDDEYDALPCDPLEPTPPPVTSRPDNPQFLAAWKALWGYPYNDMSPAHVRFVLTTKARIQREQGDNYPDWVLDHLGIETELANREALGRGLQPPRFRWVPFDDALLLPLDNDNLGAESPDRKFFYGRETQLLARYMKTLGLDAPPASLDDYLAKVVTPTLEDQKKNGAVAIKFEAAYLRSLDFEPVSLADAQAIYARYSAGGASPNSDYITLQNYIFRHIAAEAGKLGMPVHIHTGFGCGGYFDIAGANPALLESVFDDPALRGTNFVILHGGAGPYSKSAAMLLLKPNVYTDFSEQTWLLPTRQLSQTIRYFLETFPEKVLFGTDLYPGTPEINWEEVGWQTTNSAREALAIALTGMMDDGEISRARALELARMVLRGNALKLYGWPDK